MNEDTRRSSIINCFYTQQDMQLGRFMQYEMTGAYLMLDENAFTHLQQMLVLWNYHIFQLKLYF